MNLFVVVPAVLAGSVFTIWLLSKEPSNDRDWTPDQRVLSVAEFEGCNVLVRNIRNITYITKAKYDPVYYEKTFDLNDLRRVWFIVEQLGQRWAGPAHTMLSFEFEGPEYLAVSIEIRKKKGQRFSPFKGIFRMYEIMYVVADERDALYLRTNLRRDPVYLYAGMASKEGAKALLADMLERANKLAAKPEFYNTLTNSCTTNIVKHIRKIAPGRIPLSYKVLLPGYSDRLAYDVGLLDRTRPFDELKQKSLITDEALKSDSRDGYSQRIREKIPVIRAWNRAP